MVTLNAASLSNLVDTGLAAATAEYYIDGALAKISAYGYELTALTGTAGSKTKTVSQAELGWIQSVAVAVYTQAKLNTNSSKSVSAGGISLNQSQPNTFGSAASPEELAKQAAFQLSKQDFSRAFI